MTTRIYRLCGTCGRDIDPTPDPDRLCRDCWECSMPLKGKKLRQALAEEAAEARREAQRRWVDANREQYRNYQRNYMRAKRSTASLALSQPPQYHAAYLERFNLARIEQEAS